MKIIQAVNFFNENLRTPESELSLGLEKQGNNLIFISSTKKQLKFKDAKSKIKTNTRIIRVKELFSFADWVFFGKNLIQKIKACHPDIVILHEMRMPLSVLVCKNKKRIKSKIVLYQHAYKPVQNKFFKIIYHIWSTLTINTIIKNVDLFVVLSKAQKKFIRQLGIPESKIKITPSGVDTSFFKPKTKQERCNELIFLGTYDYNKLHHYLPILPELARKYPKWNFVFYGSGNFKDKINRLTIRNPNIQERGFVPKEDVPKVLSKGKIFVLPSITEIFGLSACEASSCGLPCVVNKTGGLQEIVEDGKTGFIFNNNSAELKRKIEALINNAKLREYMGKKARKRMIKYYDWDKIAKKTGKIYKEVIEDFKRR